MGTWLAFHAAEQSQRMQDRAAVKRWRVLLCQVEILEMLVERIACEVITIDWEETL